MKWIYRFLALVALAILVPAGLYIGSLDLRRSYTAGIEALPKYSGDAPDGQYQLDAGGMTFRVRVWGQANDGPTLIMLHGFPETSIMWTDLGEAAGAAGFRAIAVDQRGYSPGARPGAISDYIIDNLSGDVLAIADVLGQDRFHLVGHDWGSVVGWHTVMRAPERILTWSSLSIAHIAAFAEGLENDPEQAARSEYFNFFRQPYVPEFMFTWGGQRMLKGFFKEMPAAHREEYLAMLAEPGAVTATLNWYRAMDAGGLVADPDLDPIVKAPTLFIWGDQDMAISATTIASQGKFITGPYKEIRLSAGHNLMQEEPEAVVGAIIAHISGTPAQ